MYISSTAGMRKANVFPLPVLAAPIKSLTIQSQNDIGEQLQKSLCACNKYSACVSLFTVAHVHTRTHARTHTVEWAVSHKTRFVEAIHADRSS